MAFSENPRKVNWVQVIIFYLIAVAVSAPFRLGWINMNDVFPLPEGLGIFYGILKGIGPVTGFAIMVWIFKSKDAMHFTLWGENKRFSLLALLVIPIGITLAGVYNDHGLEKNYFGLITAMMLVAYTLGEEYGWRGYLQQALSPLPLYARVFFIALFWFLWHLNFMSQDLSVVQHFVFFIILIAGSWVLLKISETTMSLAFTAGVHMSLNLLSDVPIDKPHKWIILASAIVIWVMLIRSLIKEKSEASGGSAKS